MSKENYCFSDYPFPEETPDYPHHTQMAAYVNSYVDHYDLRRHIRFNTTVTRLTRDQDGAGWTIETEQNRGVDGGGGGGMDPVLRLIEERIGEYAMIPPHEGEGPLMVGYRQPLTPKVGSGNARVPFQLRNVHHDLNTPARPCRRRTARDGGWAADLCPYGCFSSRCR